MDESPFKRCNHLGRLVGDRLIKKVYGNTDEGIRSGRQRKR